MKKTPVLKFSVVSDEGTVRITNKIPENCLIHRIFQAEAEYTEGNFGAFCTQLLRTYYATIGWLNFDLTKHLYLRPEALKAIIAVCFTLRGKIDCTLQEFGPVELKHDIYRFYYIPPLSANKASFKPGKYEVVYISIQEKYIARFIHKYPEFKDLYERLIKNVPDGLQLSDVLIGPEELNILEEIQLHNLEMPELDLFLQARINDLLLIYFKKQKAGIENNHLKIAVDQVAHYLEQHLTEFFTDENISEMVGINKNTLGKEFKKYYKMSPTQYSIKLKMEKAGWRLKETSNSIAKIANDVGYEDANYFSTAFKRYHKCTPTQYRKQLTAQLITPLTE